MIGSRNYNITKNFKYIKINARTKKIKSFTCCNFVYFFADHIPCYYYNKNIEDYFLKHVMMWLYDLVT